MNILLSAYAAKANKGSEEGFGFNWAIQTARLGHHVWCLTSADNADNLEAYLREHADDADLQRLKFVYVSVPAWVDYLYRWQFGVYLHYLVWQYVAWKVARQLVKNTPIDVVHHATYGSLQMGSWLWRLGKPLIFGPVGGGQHAPKAFKRYFPDWFKTEVLRTVVGSLLMHLDPNVRQTLRHARMVLVTNNETATVARRFGARRVEFFLDSGMPEEFYPTQVPVRQPGATLRLLWVGRLFPRKGLRLVLEALTQVAPRVPFHLTVLGDGPMGEQLPGWLAELGLQDRVTWRGRIPHNEMQAAYLDHDAFLFGSLRDSFASQFMEAMATGLPIITLDHQGAHDFIPEAAGLKIPVTTPTATAAAIARAVEYFYDHPEARQAMSEAGYAFALTQTWPERARRLARLAGTEATAPQPVRPAPVPAQPATAPVPSI